jgi:carboxyl-terminal processing protease
MGKKHILFAALLGAACTLAAVFGGACGLAGSPANLLRGAKLTQALHVIDSQFVERADMDAVADNAIRGMVAGLDDRWSYYMTSAEYEAYRLSSANQYRGIGVTAAACPQGILLADVTADTPAYAAGLLPEEILTAIDGESIAGWTTEQFREKLLSYGEESFTLTVLGADGSSREVRLSTAAVFSSPVAWELLDSGAGYIRLKNFSSGCAAGAMEAIDALTAQGATALIFDVRYNGGGYVDEMTRLLDYLLPEGEIFASAARSGKTTTVASDARQVELPMAVLVNGGTYSAAEFFAEQLREYGAAAVVGEPTTGKSRSQTTYSLFDGSAVHLSHEAYLTVEGRDLAAEGGIVPDVTVELTDEEAALLYYGRLARADDRQLAAALTAVVQ